MKDKNRGSKNTPFDCSMVTGIGFPTKAFLIGMISFVAFVLCYLATFQVNVLEVGDTIPAFHQRMKGDPTYWPEMLVGGSSLNGMAIHTDVLEKRVAAPCVKIALDAGTLSECLAILKKYEAGCQNTKIILVDFNRVGNDVSSENWRLNHLKRMQLLSIPSTFQERCTLILNGNQNLFRRPFYEFYKLYIPPRTSPNPFESTWHDPRYAKAKVPEREQLKEHRRKIQEEGEGPIDWNCPMFGGLNVQMQPIPHETVETFLDYCRSQGIFVVFNLPPTWRGAEWKLCEEYEAYLEVLDTLPDCMVIRTPNFDSIDPDSEDESCFFDRWHMTEYGATTYTNWLVDQMLNSDKIKEHLKASQ